MLTPTEKIWHNGRFIDWKDATIHVLSHVVSYGSSVFRGHTLLLDAQWPGDFPGSRACPPPDGFGENSIVSKISGIRRTSFARRCWNWRGSIRWTHAIFRPIVLRGYGDIGVYLHQEPGGRCISPAGNGASIWVRRRWPRGVDVCVSSWNRMAPNTLPAPG